ncbi:MAG: hypothetical protein Tsb005_09910 [Gammaproteobacteria bacterium]
MKLTLSILIAGLIGLAIVFAILNNSRRSRKQRQYGPEIGAIDSLNDDYVSYGRGGSYEEDEPDPDLVELGFSDKEPIGNYQYRTSTSVATNEAAHTSVSKSDNTIAEPQPVPSQIIAISVFPQTDQAFLGYQLLQALAAAGLVYGDMRIFHRHQEMNGEGKILFSVASATEPGTFDMQKMHDINCAGLCLFMRTHGKENDIDNFELMLATAQQLAEDLGANLYDEKRAILTDEVIDKFRQTIRNQVISEMIT